MKVGLISDIHGNANALHQAFESMGAVDRVICLGDSIEQFKFSNAVVRLLQVHNALTIRGNHEDVFFSRLGERARQAAWIDQELMRWLSTRPRRAELLLDNKRALLVHDTPWRSQGDYIYPHSPGFARFGSPNFDFTFYGHTHHPVAQRVGETLIVNPGSVGCGPRTEEGVKGSCAVLDVAREQVELMEFGYASEGE